MAKYDTFTMRMDPQTKTDMAKAAAHYGTTPGQFTRFLVEQFLAQQDDAYSLAWPPKFKTQQEAIR